MTAPSPLTRNQIKSVKLLGKRSERYRQGLFLVEGERAVQQIAGNRRLSIEYLVLEYELAEKEGYLKELGELTGRNPNIRVRTVPAAVFRQISDTETAQGIMAVCRIPEPADEQSLLSEQGIILAADQVQDPGNMGTMIRTAVWFGLSGLVVSPGTVDLFHPKVVRSTAGATGVLPWIQSDLPEFLGKAETAGWRVHLLDAGVRARSFTEVRPSGKDILVVGNEANGLVSVSADEGRVSLRIDPAAETGVESLNVSVAAAIIMAHFALK